MIVLGYVLQHPTSPQKKFHARMAKPNGETVLRFGPTNGATRVADWGGSNRSSTHGSAQAAALAVQSDFTSKQSAGYQVTVRMCLAEVADTTTDAELFREFVLAAESGQAVINFVIPSAAVAQFVASAQTTAAGATAPAPTGGAPVAARAEALRLPEGEQVIRPNGERYLPRDLGGHTDIAAIRAARAGNLYTLLEGPPGTGKTALADAAFPDLIVVGCHGDMTVAHLVGAYRPTRDGGWEWEDGPLTKAMKTGRVLLLDEINRMPQDVSAILHPALDGRREIRLDDRPDNPMVQATPGFYVVGTFNPDDFGSAGLTEAIQSRFPLRITVTTDFTAARVMGVPDEFVTIAENLNTRATEARAVGSTGVWVPQMRELLAAKSFVDNGFGIDFAARAMLALCPRPEDLAEVQSVVSRVLGTHVSTLALGAQV